MFVCRPDIAQTRLRFCPPPKKSSRSSRNACTFTDLVHCKSAPTPFSVRCHLVTINFRACAIFFFFHALFLPFTLFSYSRICDVMSPVWNARGILANSRYKFLWRPGTCVISIFCRETVQSLVYSSLVDVICTVRTMTQAILCYRWVCFI